MKIFLAVDIGGTFIKYGLVKENGLIVEKKKVKTPGSLEGLLKLFQQLSHTYPNCEGLAISSPGSVSEEGIIYGTSAVKYLHDGSNIKKLIEERTNYRVTMENDANCAGLAEIWQGSAVGKKDVMVMVIGSAIGGTVIKDGYLHKGANLHGGEFGYMLLTTDYNDSDDVWSRRTSTRALVRKVAKLKNVDPEMLSGEKIFELADQGDIDCMKAVDEFYHLLSIGIYNLQYIYDPEIILIGGGISARHDLINQIDKKLDRIMDKIDLAHVKPNIQTCRFREDANLIGAVYGYIQQMSKT